MRIVEPKVEIITELNGNEILKNLEKTGRVSSKLQKILLKILFQQ